MTMKKIMKVFISILVMAMMVSLVPVQQVKAEDYLFVEKPNDEEYKTNFSSELKEDMAFYTEDTYGVAHAIGYGYFKDSDVDGNAIFAFTYASDALENKADYFVAELMKPISSGYVLANEQVYWEILGEDLIYLEFEFDVETYNDMYLYMYVGIYDSVSGYADYAKIKVKNPYYTVPISFVNIPNSEEVAIGNVVQLPFSFLPENTTMDKTLIWTSSDESVATVDADGRITGVSVGTATITATTVNGKYSLCEITVGKKIETLAFEKAEYSFVKPENFTLVLDITPTEDVACVDDIVWEISDTSVVDFGSYAMSGAKNFRTVGPGSATITATSLDGVSASCVVNVDAPITSIYISSYDAIEIRQDYTKDLGSDTKINPSNTNYDKTLTWTSSDENIATVDANGVVTGINEGTVIITATAPNGVFGQQKVKVLPRIVIESIRVDESNLELFVGDDYSCVAWVEPSSTTISKELTWTSSNENVATVEVIQPIGNIHPCESVKIHAVGSGSCVITVTSVNGKSDSITVNVSEGATRIFGDSRYETAFKVADALKVQLKKDKFSNVIVASGTGFADALAGSYLSAQREAPILMTDMKQKNIDNLVAYINKNLTAGGTVYVLGGKAAVSENVDKALSNYNVKRLAGENRYETNMKIINEVITGKYDDELLICTATNFADSLSVSATGLPIMLVGNSLTEEQRDFIARQSISNVYIIGGTAAVSKKLEKQVDDALPSRSIQIAGKWEDISADIIRIAGASRYETSTLVAKEFLPDAKKAVMAYAKNYPDGLSGGAFAYSLKAPLLLTDGNSYSVTSKYTVSKKINSGFVLGGSGLVTDEAVRSILGLPSNQEIQSK